MVNDFENNEEGDEHISHIMNDYVIEKEEVEEIKNLADELGIDEDDAYQIWETGI